MLAAAIATAAVARAAPPLADRIGRTDPARYTRAFDQGRGNGHLELLIIGIDVETPTD
jgi:hypothetical protein